ncbi:hypothetical protein Nepgr_021979 [Nepenthes gracilis]|uniref:Uncharacterized protein n=1 Tax=Nepenthes gracilis TaxID=150966 RepID=A0AAD3SZE6_NEPGR|nr:hypothetical protein Nepgr_021979 [Nepenthes gracilis]
MPVAVRFFGGSLALPSEAAGAYPEPFTNRLRFRRRLRLLGAFLEAATIAVPLFPGCQLRPFRRKVHAFGTLCLVGLLRRNVGLGNDLYFPKGLRVLMRQGDGEALVHHDLAHSMDEQVSAEIVEIFHQVLAPSFPSSVGGLEHLHLFLHWRVRLASSHVDNITELCVTLLVVLNLSVAAAFLAGWPCTVRVRSCLSPLAVGVTGVTPLWTLLPLDPTRMASNHRLGTAAGGRLGLGIVRPI